MSRATDKAYSCIRDAILSGEFPAGAPLGEEALAKWCGVSRTPVRDALRRLEAELLVQRSDSQRSFVAEWSLDDVADSFELRAMLEGLAARRAAERMTPAILEAMRRCHAVIGQAIDGGKPDVDAFLAGNREFHAAVLEAAGSPRLTALIATLVEQPIVWRTAHHYAHSELVRSHREHGELLSAFARGDGCWAHDAMGAHIRRAFHAYADAHQGLATFVSEPARRKA